MVGRELHMICPYGEDHPGLDRARGVKVGMLILRTEKRAGVSRRSTVTRMMAKVLAWRVLLVVMICSLQAPILGSGHAPGVVGTMNTFQGPRTRKMMLWKNRGPRCNWL